MQHRLAEIGIEGRIELHVSPPSSQYRKIKLTLKRGGKFNLDDAANLLRIDVRIPSEPECYRVLGIIHQQWRPVTGQFGFAGRFRDYIGNPRYNGYRGLHTTVLSEEPRKGSPRKLIEFRIYTPEIEQTNKYGIIAASLQVQSPILIKNAWWRDSESREFVRSQGKESVSSQIYVFSPVGEIHWLPPESTPVDYAFRIHSTIGPYSRRFWVNGRAVSFDYQLRNGDLVEVEFDPQYYSVQVNWLKVVRTTNAKRHIERFLKQQERSPNEGRRLIDEVLRRELGIYQLRFTDEEIENSLSRVTRYLGCPDLDTLYLEVREGQISPDKVVSRMIESQMAEYIVLQGGKFWPPNRIRIAQCWMNAGREQKHSRATRVTPGAKIVGCIAHSQSTQPWLIVHRQDCRQLSADASTIPLEWRATGTSREAVEISVSAWDRPKLLDDILHAAYGLYEQGLYLDHVHADRLRDGTASIKLTVDAPTLEQIRLLEEKLREAQNSGRIKSFETWQLLPGQKVLLASRFGRKQEIPYTVSEIHKREMFFGRTEELAKIAECIRGNQNLIVLYGHKRIGKSSLLHYLKDSLLLSERDIFPVYLDAQGGVNPFTTEQFLLKLAEAINYAMTEQGFVGRDRGIRLKPRDIRSDSFWGFRQWLDKTYERLHGRKLLLLIDEFSKAEEALTKKQIDPSFFEGLRWLVTTTPSAVFLLSMQETVYNPIISTRWRTSSRVLLQKAYPVRLTVLDTDSATKLILQPMGHTYQYEDQSVKRILQLSACHPYFLQALCLDLATHMAQQDRTNVTLNDLEVVIPNILSTGHYFSHFLESLPGFHREILAATAYASQGNNLWVAQNEIHSLMETHGNRIQPRGFAKALADLCSLNIVEPREARASWEYRISICLFEMWLLRNVPFGFLAQQRRSR
ncbi:MAG: TGS domain-containing protein [Thaumarchaeota archaeon]|nr:TGS domain-containing protein [Nitrososphaerota archaeon]